jgi:hypothetical protein
MMLGEADRIVVQIVGQPRLLADFGQCPAIEVAAHARHAGFDVGAAADRGEIEQRGLHGSFRRHGWDGSSSWRSAIAGYPVTMVGGKGRSMGGAVIASPARPVTDRG